MQPPEPKKLFVKNLKYTTTDESLAAHFQAAGEITYCKIIRREDGSSMGYGFVAFATEAQAEAAMKAFDGQPFEGRTLSCEQARVRRPH